MQEDFICRKCNAELMPGAAFCHLCGTSVERTQKRKTRGNGQGSVYKRGSSWVAVVTVGYIREGTERPKRITRSKACKKKSDAVAAIPALMAAEDAKRPGTKITFKALYDLWLPTHRVGKDTIGCYKAAIKHLRPVWHMSMDDITIDDLQECLDDCPAGKRTRENMKATVNLVYKYGIPRNMVPLDRNLAPFLIVSGDPAARRESFTEQQIEQIRKAIDTVPFADYVYCLIYLGFRPSEFLALSPEDYHADKHYFIGGAKTDAGIDRLVPISPKIRLMVQAAATKGGETVFCRQDGKRWPRDSFADTFYSVLEAVGIDNPMVEISGGVKRHKYTPHSCRHTFATLMKRVPGASKDKQALIGHSSEEQLKYYQDAPLEDLRKIVDAI